MGDASHGGCAVLISKSSGRTRFVRILVMQFFLLVALPALKGRFQTAVFHSNASRGGKDFPQKIRDNLSDKA